MRKNVGSQVIGAQMVSATDGSAFTGSVSVAVTVDGGTQGAGGGTGPTHEGNGFHSYIPTQAETNGNHVAFTFTGTGAVPVTVQVFTTSLDPHDTVRAGLTALPNAAADAAGGLPISDAGGLDLDTQLANTHEITAARMGALTDWIDGGRLDLIIDAVLVDTAEIGAAGAGLTEAGGTGDHLTAINLPDQTMNITGDITGNLSGSVGSVTGAVGSVTGAVGSVTGNVGGNVVGSVASVTGAINTAAGTITTLDGLDTAQDAQHATTQATLSGLVLAQGTIGSTGNDTTHLHLDGLTYGDDEINDYLLVVYDASEDEYHARWVEDWATTGDLATVSTLPFTPQDATDTYWLLPIRQDVTGGSGLDAAGVRAAIGLASANLDTQLDALPTAAENRAEMDSNSTQLAAIVADTGELQTDWTNGGRLDLIVDAVLADTNELQGDWANGGRLDLIVDAILADTGTDGVVVAAGSKSGYALASDGLDLVTAWAVDITGDVTGSLSGSVGSVTGAVGSVTGNVGGNVVGSVASVTGAVGSVTGNVGGNVVGSVASVTGAINTAAGTITTLDALDTAQDGQHATTQSAIGDLEDVSVADILTTQMTEAYNADGAAPTLAQSLFVIMQRLTDFVISSTTISVKKLDGSTEAYTLTLDSADEPTSSTRAT